MKRSLLRRLGMDWVDVGLFVALIAVGVWFASGLPWGAVFG